MARSEVAPAFCASLMIISRSLVGRDGALTSDVKCCTAEHPHAPSLLRALHAFVGRSASAPSQQTRGDAA